MRKTVAILILTLVAALGTFVPVVSAAPAAAQPKVVIIVGATHSVTATYRSYADAAYAEARKYTTNVVKVYSPYATWAKVKAATTGANIVIYMGHGNGWPSPYTYDPLYTTKDGFGLNATSGAGDSNNKYYGEPYVSTLDLADDAIVLLHHLCYAAGNSEPGGAAPSVSVARQRLDNYAAGFLKAGASAVIADGHAGRWTTSAPSSRPTRPSSSCGGRSRTPRATSCRSPRSEPPAPPRSPIRRPRRPASTDHWSVTGTSRPSDILGDGYSGTSGDPANLLVPGNADVGAAGAGLHGDPASLTAGRPRRARQHAPRRHPVADRRLGRHDRIGRFDRRPRARHR